MKQIIFIFLMFNMSQSWAQNETLFFQAFKNADIASMESYLEDNIDFCIFEDQQIMSKKAAMQKLKHFLGNNKIISVEIMHKGASKDKSSQYKVAKVITQKEELRLFVFATGEIGARSIKEIRINRF